MNNHLRRDPAAPTRTRLRERTEVCAGCSRRREKYERFHYIYPDIMPRGPLVPVATFCRSCGTSAGITRSDGQKRFVGLARSAKLIPRVLQPRPMTPEQIDDLVARVQSHMVEPRATVRVEFRPATAADLARATRLSRHASPKMRASRRPADIRDRVISETAILVNGEKPRYGWFRRLREPGRAVAREVFSRLNRPDNPDESRWR